MRKPWFPHAELRFSARSGFLTQELWTRFFSGNHDPTWNLKRWSRLTTRGWFVPHPSHLYPTVLVPNLKNHDVQGASFVFARPPYVAQLKHDEVLYEGLIRLEQEGIVSGYVTEAELKRAEATGDFRSSKALKLPDLVLSLSNGKSLAIEVELTQKSRRRYWAMLNAYRARNDVDAILFVVPSRAVIRAIVEASRQVSFPLKAVPIGFVRIENWRLDAANKKLSFGESPISLREFSQSE